MSERDLLKEVQAWYDHATRLVDAEWIEKHLEDSRPLYVGFLLFLVQGLSDRIRAIEQDTQRLDWLERTQTPVYRCTVGREGCRTPGAQPERWDEFSGWSCSMSLTEPQQPTIRLAIDAAKRAVEGPGT